MKKQRRLVGIDLFRGLAIYCVVILHTDEGIEILPPAWSWIVQFSGFAVPFFLATAFYLTFSKLHESKGGFSLKERLMRLLVPYLFWSALYVAYKVLKYLVQSETDSISKLFHDPIGIIFLGKAAFQLYFLPLLILGTVLAKPVSLLIERKIKLNILILLAILSLILYELILISGNSFENGASLAFQSLLNSIALTNLALQNNQLLRIILVLIAWTIRCLPYIFVAAIASHPNVKVALSNYEKSYVYTILLVLLFLAINSFGGNLLPQSLYELSRGYLALLSAIALSNYLPSNRTIANLSLCSFGIYLTHLLFVETFQILEKRLYSEELFRTSTLNLLMFALLSFAVSWIVTDILMRKKSLAKLMFGV
ncbi:acyltransferase [Candidatus Gracilibacteria bacterium]|jgi:surface polysaccharide O-acyltransferase-like enzyme|nr:acyltransferase [Candidatus Gracilibacteria bacterium]NJP17914.1 acyltransferase [Hydrococcus sp. CRU_1_1]NJQ97244.1 acyltransferase [Hydrococcus sp. CSU_1_8]